jgi:CPA1 family monovalent cation:H+ antiporter
VALALALGLPPEVPQREKIVTISFAVVAFSVFAQGLTMASFLRRMGEMVGPWGLPPKRHHLSSLALDR